MKYLDDVGEYIPYAKKENSVPEKKIFSSPTSTTKKALSLKDVWPEPNWIESHLDGIPVTVLASIYSIYHSLAKKPHTTEKFRFSGVRITAEMWESAYIEAVNYIRKACENATTEECVKEFELAFNEHFNNDGKTAYKTYAAGTRTPKTFYHPLGGSGSVGEFKKLLPLLDWPLSVNAKKIPAFPLELKHIETQEITYSLGKINKKSVTWCSTVNEAKNEFDSYEEAVSALIEYHGDDFKISGERNKEIDVYVPKKDHSNMLGVEDTYDDKDPNELMLTYGFRGIQFGNYLPQKERQAYVNNAFHSLGLLASILNIPNRWIGGGKLGLAFGARGHGYAAAHYELDQQVINLTRFNGPGCISHEILHTLDSRFAKRWLNRDGLLSDIIVNNDILSEDVDAKYRARFSAFAKLTAICTESSSFTENAKRIESQKGARKYWTKPSELCARAFEAFIQDELSGQGVNRQWLALGTLEADYPMNGMHPYPTGAFRKELREVLLEVVPVIFAPSKTQQ